MYRPTSPMSARAIAISLLFVFAADGAWTATPAATVELPAKAKWHQLTSLGLLLVGTD